MRKELKYYGIHACLLLAEYRMEDVIKVYIHSSNAKAFSKILKRCAKSKIAYHMVSNEDLNKICASVHHEGVCIVAKERIAISERSFFQEISSRSSPACFLYFDGVQNPHNIGSILRTCAHFSIPYILGEKGKLPSLSPSACRIAKGAAEIVQIVEVQNATAFLAQLKQKEYALVTTSSHAKDSLYGTPLPSKVVIVLGAEAKGVGKMVESLSTHKVKIPGSSLVESLNVSVATALCLGEFYRQHSEARPC